MENLVTADLARSAKGAVPSPDFWRGKRVFLTGHTGFKGCWLSLWLTTLGARVCGYSLAPSSDPCMFEVLGLAQSCESKIGDIRDKENLQEELSEFEPEIVFHLAAQPLVRQSYITPLETFSTNVMGTANLLDACRDLTALRAIVCVTTDKVYENREWLWAYRETEALGGHDPYSASKACAEFVASAYRNSFFSNDSQISVATARAGNIVGGGDWADDRLLPDCIRAITSAQELEIRHPGAIRPWQHALEPLCGYLLLAENLFSGNKDYATAFNFGPSNERLISVKSIVEMVADCWDGALSFRLHEADAARHEANILALDSTKSRQLLNWQPKLSAMKAVQMSIDWYKAFYDSGSKTLMIDLTENQIADYSRKLCGPTMPDGKD
ncbi:MAG: CDP-glucose 4,6-dehydratase [Proteobacteria bacterium]|nr:CDP-glucose 4,6-dehydratase [Pseudomonadota bacterium]